MKTLSICVIVGDGGVGTLGRLLRSVLVRPDGPLADEIVLAWNGKDDEAFRRALVEGAPDGTGIIRVVPPLPTEPGSVVRGFLGVDVVVLRQAWQSRFDTARNESFALATGEWAMWLDTDDVVACAADKDGPDGLRAVMDVERDGGIPPAPAGGAPGVTLRKWLSELPFDCNAVLAPYDYTINEQGYVTTRQMMKRIIRRSTKFVWRNAIHEVLYPASSVGEKSVQNPGLLVRHYPAEEVLARVERNRDIVMTMQTPGMPVDARHAFDLANAQITLGNQTAADESLKRAIERATNPVDHYNYRLARAGLNLEMGRLEVGLNECIAAIVVQPMRPDAYFGAAEALYRGGKPDAVVAFFDLGAAKAAQLSTLDRPLARWVMPRAQAALAYLAMGQPEKGLVLAKEALERYPLEPLAIEAHQQLAAAVGRAKAIDGLLTSLEYLQANGGAWTATGIVCAVEGSPALRGITSLSRFRTIQAASSLSNPPQLELACGGAEGTFLPVDGEAVDAEALVAEASDQRLQLLEVTPDGGGFKVKCAPTYRAEIAFFCPHAAEPWKASDVDTKGLGGSEGSVVYLARTLAKRGYPVSIYTPGGPGQPAVVKGVIEQGVEWFDAGNTREKLVVACRAPWVLRNPRMTVPTLVWHQDNGYDNDWSWNEVVEARSRGSLHVSDWAKQGLLKDLGTHPVSPHHVIGNGITEPFALCRRPVAPKRNPKKLVYASDLSRGLGPLIAMWPRILAAEPEAELHIFGSYAVTMALAQATPGMGIIEEVQKFSEQVAKTPRVFTHGWVPHHVLAEEMLSAGVYAYPGGPMPEGFGVSLVQAAAAGCAMVYPDAGALPDVLPTREYQRPRLSGLNGSDDFADAIVDAMKHADTTIDREGQSETTWKMHSWEAVADRFEQALEGV